MLVTAYFICFMKVLFPDSPAPNKQKCHIILAISKVVKI